MNPKEKEQREVLCKLVSAASAGKLEWLHKAIIDSGYLDPEKVTSDELSDLWGVSAPAITKWRKDGKCPCSMTKNGKKQIPIFDLRNVISWKEDKFTSEIRALSENKKPSLDLLRGEKARLAQLSRMEKEGKLLPKDLIHDALGRLASLLRGAGEQLQREYGRNAQSILDSTLDDFKSEVVAIFGKPIIEKEIKRGRK